MGRRHRYGKFSEGLPVTAGVLQAGITGRAIVPRRRRRREASLRGSLYDKEGLGANKGADRPLFLPPPDPLDDLDQRVHAERADRNDLPVHQGDGVGPVEFLKLPHLLPVFGTHLRREGIVVAHLDCPGKVVLHLPADDTRGLLRRPARSSAATEDGQVLGVAEDFDERGGFGHPDLLGSEREERKGECKEEPTAPR